MDPRDRFTARADVYERARPSYPKAALDVLCDHYNLTPQTRVADLGSGTGIFARLLLGSGAKVIAVEPNADMRNVAEAALKSESRFQSIAGRAEATTLPHASIDLVTAAQAFHWFDLDQFIPELTRILAPQGRAAFVWNDRDLEGTPFLRAYETILNKHCPGYAELQGKSNTPEKFDRVFGKGQWTKHSAKNEQRLDQQGLIERVMSSSYAPREGSPRDALVNDLEQAFMEHAEKNEAVTISYTTVIIGGTPTTPTTK
jgi:ubiquinone/menaquinone biosynthesis C-methylase UbiE